MQPATGLQAAMSSRKGSRGTFQRQRLAAMKGESPFSDLKSARDCINTEVRADWGGVLISELRRAEKNIVGVANLGSSYSCSAESAWPRRGNCGPSA